MHSYNLFRRKDGEGLCCAVPENRTVPGFLNGGRWTFGGKLDRHATRPLGFDRQAAATSVRFNGFYLFHSVEKHTE